MKQLFIYTYLEFKRFLKILPYFIAGSIILAVIANLTSFTAKNVFNVKSLSNYKLKIAVVIEDESDLMDMLFKMLESADCTTDTCDFIETDIDSANEMIANKEVTALLVIPEGFFESIKDGTNIPIEITFSEGSNMISLILRQLSMAGAKTLSAAQCGIYTQYDIYNEHDKMFYNPDANAYLNDTYLKYVLQRETMFRNTTAYPTGKLSIAESYLCSGIGLIILLISMSCATFFDNENKVFKQYMNKRGINTALMYLVKILIFTGFTSVMLYVLQIATSGSFPVTALIPAVLCSGCIAIFILNMCSGTSVGILTLFTINFCACFLSGYFLPVSFFPEALRTLGNLLPSGMVSGQVQYAYGYGDSHTTALLIYSLIFYILTLLTEELHQRRDMA